MSQSQLDFMKQQALAGAEPFASTYAKAKASKWGSLTYAVQGPPSGGTIDCGSYSNPNIGCTLEDDDSTAALTQALLWYISGNQTYANNAIAIMNAYSKGLKGGHTNTNATVQASWSASKFPAAAEIIRYSNAGWADADFTAFQSLLTNQYLNSLTAVPGLVNKNGNWAMTTIGSWFGIAVVTENQALFQQAVSALQGAIPAYFYYFPEDGATPKTNPLVIGKWNGQKVFDASVSGICQETCRDLQHTQFGISGAFNALETAYAQGTDLYTPFANRLTTALEFNAGLFPLGFSDMSSGGTKQGSSVNICGGNVTLVLNPTFEIAYNAYANRLGYSLPNTLAYLTGSVRKITYQENAPSENHPMVFETLHHGGSPGVVPPGTTPAPTPSSSPTPTPAPSALSCIASKLKPTKARIDVTFSGAPASFEVNGVNCQ